MYIHAVQLFAAFKRLGFAILLLERESEAVHQSCTLCISYIGDVEL
jgi:hypothetical protein